jgi:hypothetical protein
VGCKWQNLYYRSRGSITVSYGSVGHSNFIIQISLLAAGSYDKTNSLFHPTYITYYWECVSQRGSYTHQHFSGNPGAAAGSWHSYTIVYAQSSQFPERWILRVDFGTPQTTCDVYPYNPEDLQAFVETTYSRIRIDGSHFKDLSRYTGQGWPYWDRHIAHAHNPYSVQPIWRADCGYNCEFKAAGGG